MICAGKFSRFLYNKKGRGKVMSVIKCGKKFNYFTFSCIIYVLNYIRLVMDKCIKCNESNKNVRYRFRIVRILTFRL